MRIWDINPGYLNRQSLLGEHRELHGIVSIMVHGKKGYSRHPETLRWAGHGWSLRKRHQLLAAEMALRGYREKTPVRIRSGKGVWPAAFIDEPGRQYRLLEKKYEQREPGRIPLPISAQQLWSQHKYSVLARDVVRYQRIGRQVSQMRAGDDFFPLAEMLTRLLHEQPSAAGIRNALQHMWGYVAEEYRGARHGVDSWSLPRLLAEIQRLAVARNEPYLMASTALSELKVWIPA